MTTVLLVRHGLTALTGPVLAGWTPGVSLDDKGQAQAEALALRLAPVALDAIVTSPLERCTQTAAVIAVARDGQVAAAVHLDERLGECHYGDWTGKQLKKLAEDPLWRVVQVHPSAARFPGPDGETLPGMQYRAVCAVRDWNAKLGTQACYLICSHGDVIKAIVADSLGLHLDQFQRIQIDPCSLTVIKYTSLRPFLLRLNDTGGEVADLVAAGRASHENSDAMVGGGAGVAVHDAEDETSGGADTARSAADTADGSVGAVGGMAETVGGTADTAGSEASGSGRLVRQMRADAQG